MKPARISIFCTAFLILALSSQAANASDFQKERRWADQLRDNLVIGDAITLQAGKVEFLAIYTPASGSTQRGGVILLHGLGAHPDWPDVIAPLRMELPERGWATLSLQMPVRPNDARFEEYPPLFQAANERISAGIQYFREQGILNVALVGHSLGAAMGAHYLAEQAAGSDRVRAFVGIGMGQHPGSVAHTPDSVAKIAKPVLELYGSQDLKGVLESTGARKIAAQRAGNAVYQQRKVMGADHFFRGLEDSLAQMVASWLTRYAPSAQVPSSQVESGKP